MEINLSVICEGQCGKVDMKGRETVIPPEMNICYNCKSKVVVENTL